MSDTPADAAFTFFLATVTPADFSDSEWLLFRFLKLRVTT